VFKNCKVFQYIIIDKKKWICIKFERQKKYGFLRRKILSGKIDFLGDGDLDLQRKNCFFEKVLLRM
jgi:hypothetical protein